MSLLFGPVNVLCRYLDPLGSSSYAWTMASLVCFGKVPLLEAFERALGIHI